MDVPGLSPDEKAPLLWRELEHLIIDELSMLSGEFLDRLDAEVQKVRSDSRPFGGIQLIACGDLLQLPPIENSYEPDQGVEFDAAAPAEVTNRLGPLFCARGRCFESRCFLGRRVPLREADGVLSPGGPRLQQNARQNPRRRRF